MEYKDTVALSRSALQELIEVNKMIADAKRLDYTDWLKASFPDWQEYKTDAEYMSAYVYLQMGIVPVGDEAVYAELIDKGLAERVLSMDSERGELVRIL